MLSLQLSRGMVLRSGPRHQYFQVLISQIKLSNHPNQHYRTLRTGQTGLNWKPRTIKIKIRASRSLNSGLTHLPQKSTRSLWIHSIHKMRAWNRRNWRTWSNHRWLLETVHQSLKWTRLRSLSAWCISLVPGSSVSTSSTVIHDTCARATPNSWTSTAVMATFKLPKVILSKASGSVLKKNLSLLAPLRTRSISRLEQIINIYRCTSRPALKMIEPGALGVCGAPARKSDMAGVHSKLLICKLGLHAPIASSLFVFFAKSVNILNWSFKPL